MNSFCFYATHSKCGEGGMFRKNPDNGIIEHDAFGSRSWWGICYKCHEKIRMEDLSMKYPGVEIVSYSGANPELQSHGGILSCTLNIDGGLYVFLVESSGKRGSYPHWTKTWVSCPISEDGKAIPNYHKCGSSYWNDHCWFPLESTNYDGDPPSFKSLGEVIEIVRKNKNEIIRRAGDKKYHAG